MYWYVSCDISDHVTHHTLGSYQQRDIVLMNLGGEFENSAVWCHGIAIIAWCDINQMYLSPYYHITWTKIYTENDIVQQYHIA